MDVDCAWCGGKGKKDEMHTYTHDDGTVEYAHDNSECELQYDNSRGLN